MTLTERSVADFLEAIRSPAPTPGGGSASALAGALGASLLAMVAGMPKHRAGSEEDIARLQGTGARCSEIGGQLAAAVNEDSEAYDLVMAAYRLPKASDAQKAERSARIQAALRGAVEVPLAVMRGAVDALTAGAIVAELGNRNAETDVGVAFELLGAAFRGARLNVEINLAQMKNSGYVDDVRQQTDTLATRCAEAIGVARRSSAGPGGPRERACDSSEGQVL